MTPDLIRNLADLVDNIGHVGGRKGDAVCAALGLDPDATWEETAAALRARADAIAAPGLPEGWKWHINGVGAYRYPKPGGPIVEARVVQERMELFGPVPLSVIAAVLARAGVTT